MEGDRRAPVRSLMCIDPEPRRVRENLESIQQGLEGVSSSVSRRVVRLVGLVIDEWLRNRNPAVAPLEVEIARKGQTIRVETTITDWGSEAEFWGEVGHMATTVELADRWGIDRRKESGAWFEIDPA